MALTQAASAHIGAAKVINKKAGNMVFSKYALFIISSPRVL
jgi:hypothetical protein